MALGDGLEVLDQCYRVYHIRRPDFGAAEAEAAQTLTCETSGTDGQSAKLAQAKANSKQQVLEGMTANELSSHVPNWAVEQLATFCQQV